MALGFGRIDNASVLGRPLDFSVSLNLQANEFVAQECVSAEVASGDNKLHPEGVRVQLAGTPGAAQARVRVQTLARIDEPIVTVNVSVGCPPSLSREFVVFVDPPLVTLPQAAIAAGTGAAGARAADAPAPGVSTSPPRAGRRASARRAARPAVQGRDGTVAARNTARKAVPSAPPAPRPRLMLDPPMSLPQADPTPAPAETVAAAPQGEPAADSSEAAQQRLREREYLLGLEETLERMRRDNAATQKQLAELQVRLREAELARQSNPAVYGLVSIILLLLVAIAALLWRQSRLRRQGDWWTPSELQSARESLAPPATQAAADTAQLRTVVESPPAPPPDLLRSLVQAPSSLPEPPAAEPAPTAMEVARRELSVEELIDLEQQADFFVVLGQDEAAIDLLMGHVRSSGGASPMPYLKLLDIYRRRGEREAYERIRERFNRRFNAYAPDWDTDPAEGRPLESYADVMSRLQSQWDTPSQAMELLESLLFRRDSSESTFDLPAYGELLFLYSHARDLAEHDTESGGVDLLLPLGRADDEAAFTSLTGPAPLDVQEPREATSPVDLELDLSDQEAHPKT